MIIKVIGAILVITACGSVGFQIAAQQKKTAKDLRQLLTVIDYISCQLQYRLLSLPDIFRELSQSNKGLVGRFFTVLTDQLEKQESANVEYCVLATIHQLNDIPAPLNDVFLLLGRSLGQFDLDGQLKVLTSTRDECKRIIDKFTENQEVRLRSYQTLALCGGAALAILFI